MVGTAAKAATLRGTAAVAAELAAADVEIRSGDVVVTALVAAVGFRTFAPPLAPIPAPTDMPTPHHDGQSDGENHRRDLEHTSFQTDFHKDCSNISAIFFSSCSQSENEKKTERKKRTDLLQLPGNFPT